MLASSPHFSLKVCARARGKFSSQIITLWCQLEDMFQLIVTPQGIEKVTIQLIDTPTKVYAIGARLFLSKVPLEVLQNWVLIQLIVTPHILGKVQGQIKEVCRLIEPCLLIGTREYKESPGTRGPQVRGVPRYEGFPSINLKPRTKLKYHGQKAKV